MCLGVESFQQFDMIFVLQNLQNFDLLVVPSAPARLNSLQFATFDGHKLTRNLVQPQVDLSVSSLPKQTAHTVQLHAIHQRVCLDQPEAFQRLWMERFPNERWFQQRFDLLDFGLVNHQLLNFLQFLRQGRRVALTAPTRRNSNLLLGRVKVKLAHSRCRGHRLRHGLLLLNGLNALY